MTTQIDGIHIFEPIQKKQKPIQMTYDSQIIENYAPGKVIDVDDLNSLASVQDSKGNPVTFILKNNNELVVVRKTFNEGGKIEDKKKSTTGYKEISIRNSDNKKVQSFGVSQDMKTKNYSISMVEEDMAKSGKMDIYMTKPLDNDASKMYTALSKQDNDFWNYRGSIHFDPSDEVTQVLVGDFPLDEEDNSPAILVATSEQNKAFYYIVDSDLSNEQPEHPKKMSLGDTSTHIIDFVIGKRSYFEGVYTLQKLHDRRFLRFHSFPIRGEPGPSTLLHTFRNNEDPKSIRALAEADYRSGVYVGGNGLYYLSSKVQEFEAENTGKELNRELPLEVLLTNENAPGLQKITLREDKDKITLWALNEKKEMLTTEQEKAVVSGYHSVTESKKWTEPIVIARNVYGWAAIRNQIEKTNDLMILRPGNKLTHLIQDPQTTNFRHTDIPLDDKDFMQTYSSYSTQLTFQDKDGFPHLNLEDDDGFEFSASEWCEVSVNGNAYELRPTEKTLIKTDMQGIITLVHKADSISPPIFKVIVNGNEKIVNPAQKVDKKLDSLQSAEVLKKEEWIDENGIKHKLLSENVKEEDLNAAVEGLQNFTKIKEDLPPDGSSSSNYLNGVNLKTENRPKIWGMSISPDGNIKYFEEQEVYLNMVDGEEKSWWERALARAAGNVLEWMKDVARKFVQVVVKLVDGAWKVAIKIGEVAYSFVVECLGHLYNGINWLLDKVLGIDLEKIRKWIGYVFNMKEVRMAHKVVSHITKQLPVYAEKEVEALAEKVDKFFIKLIEEANNIKEIQHPFARQSYQDSKQEIIKGMSAKQRAAMGEINKSPSGNFMNYQIGHQSNRNAPSLEALFQEGEFQQFLQAHQDTITEIVDLLKSIGGDIKKMGEAFKGLLNGEMDVNQLLTAIVGESLKVILKCAHAIAKLIFKLIKLFVKTITNITTKTLYIPFLTPLVKLMLQKEEDLSAIDHLILPLAMPVVMGYKIIFSEEKPMFDEKGVEKIMKLKGKELIVYLCNSNNSLDKNPVLRGLKIFQSFGGRIIADVSNYLALIGAIADGLIPNVIGAGLNFLNIFSGIPLGNWEDLPIRKWIFDFSQFFLSCLPLGKIASVVSFIMDCIKLPLNVALLISGIQETPHKAGILIWSFLNEIVALIDSCLITVAETIPDQKIKALFVVPASIGISIEFLSGLSHAIVDTVIPDSHSLGI